MSPLSYGTKEISIQDSGDSFQEVEEWPPSPISVSFLDGKFIVFNHDHGSILYGSGRYFGIPVGIRKPKTQVGVRSVITG